ncbi:malonic semialdehyde reductase [Mycobacterium sp. 21AC1]|uniref:malonic semialdehyde reductase n=1 Tax=[Mycobacterium] appelbergii TaxID=2939269 RepID=UPI002938F63F|nr:malonic semialdehyde reductase [Mycobacterium sp. 21AC1]MDV3128633.1 malonic semialdehyde reductase [Mycobacterium sp. 21AC1]
MPASTTRDHATQPYSDTAQRLPTLDEAGRNLLFRRARTPNTFLAEPVDDALLKEVWDLAQWPPTSANGNPLRVVFVRTPEAKARLLPCVDEGNRPKVAAAPVTAVLATDTAFFESIPKLLPYKPEMRDSLAGRTDRDYVGEFNATLQIGYFIMAVRAVGLAAGPMAGFDRAGVDAEFLTGTTWRSILTVNIGHPGPGAWFDRLPRHEPSDVLSFV